KGSSNWIEGSNQMGMERKGTHTDPAYTKGCMAVCGKSRVMHEVHVKILLGPSSMCC
ncbi:hypothetical protein AVEN_82724-1, partial [Araneus ventricosus]